MSHFPSTFELVGRTLGEGAPCLVIAEAGVSHLGDIDKAYRLIDMAVDAGADAFKTQHYRTDRLVGPSAPEWRERLRPKELPDEMIAAMQGYCKQRGIPFLCTPHDDLALDFLDRELDLPAFKIGSGELQNWPFLADVASRGKPIILSTGMYRLDQIEEAIAVIAEQGAPPLAILHCVTSYPADPNAINLRVMDRIREFFPGPVGYSDHTHGTAIPLAAVAMGADIIEKHITLDVDIANAQDWKVACTPDDFGTFVRDIRVIESAMGDGRKVIGEGERAALRWARKSLTFARPLAEGTVLRADMLVAQRPGTGIPPSELASVLGRKLDRDVDAGELLAESLLRDS